MRQIILLMCLAMATAIFAQSGYDMKRKYFQKGENTKITIDGSGNPKTAAEDINGNFVFGGKAQFGDKKYPTDWIERYNITTNLGGGSTSYKENAVNDCIPLPNGEVICVSNPEMGRVNVNSGIPPTSYSDNDITGFERAVYSPTTETVIIFGIDKDTDIWRPELTIHNTGTDGFKTMSCRKALLFGYNSFEDYHKNSFATINKDDYGVWVYEAKNKQSDQTAIIGLVGYKEGESAYFWDEINVQKYINEFVSDFRPFTMYESKSFEEIYNVQWAISGIHPKEDGNFLITISFKHWTQTNMGKAGYQTGILGIECDINQSNIVTDTWVAFPWAVREASSNEEIFEIRPYFTAYLGENDVAVYDQERGYLFAINSELDGQKTEESSSKKANKSRELQDWLLSQRVIAQIPSATYPINGYCIGFAHPNTTPEAGQKKAITLVQAASDGKNFTILKFNP
jgi:hypothetical protein